jgi:hypothetical protein
MWKLNIFILVLTTLNRGESKPSMESCKGSARWRWLKDKPEDVHLIVDIAEQSQSASFSGIFENALRDIAKEELLSPPLLVQDDNFFTGVIETTTDVIHFDEVIVKKLIDSHLLQSLVIPRFVKNKWEVTYFQLFQFSNDSKGCSYLLHACCASGRYPNNDFRVKKEVLVVTKGLEPLSNSEIDDCIDTDFNYSGLTFKSMKGEGLCLCETFEHFLNNCDGTSEDGDQADNTIVVVIIIAGIFVIIVVIVVTIDQCFEE